MDERNKAEAIAAARHEIARRIARFCTGLSSEEFNALLDRMAHVQWKYDVFPLVDEPYSVRGRNDESDETNCDGGIISA